MKDFHELRPFANKVFKFKQNRYSSLDGECLALSLKWIQEQMAQYHASMIGAVTEPSIFRSEEWQAPGDIHRQQVYLRAAALRGGAFSGTATDSIEQQLGLRKRRQLDDLANTFQELNYPAAVANLVQNLHPGMGVLLNAYMEEDHGGFTNGEGHAVALFCYGSGRYSFFDPNCGSYEILDLSGFLGAWIRAYERMNRNVSAEEDDAPFVVYGAA